MPSLLWRIVERRLERRLPADRVATALGDLMDDYGGRRRTHGRLGTLVWLARECRSLTSAYRIDGPRPLAHRRGLADVTRTEVWQAWRGVRARPGATLAGVAVLTIGIGLVSAMFALADPYLLAPLPYPRPHELAHAYASARPGTDIPRLSDWDAREDLFAGLAAFGERDRVTVNAGAEEVGLRTVHVSPGFFPVLGLGPAAPPDWRPYDAGETPVVLTAATARRLFGSSDPVGRSLARAEGGTLRVASVLPSRFVFPDGRTTSPIDALLPLGDPPLVTFTSISASGTSYSSTNLTFIARLRAGVTPGILEAALSTGSGERRATGLRVSAEWLGARLTARNRPLALGALAAGLLILLVSAANVANLLLARGAHRTREFAAREALGASGAALARLVLWELALLTACGIAGGLFIAQLVLGVSAVVIPVDYIGLGSPSITPRVIAFACVAGGVVMLAGLVPAIAAWRITPLALFAQTTSRESRFVRAFRCAMTAAQCAVAIVLLVGASLLGRSYLNLITQDTGLDGRAFAVTVSYPAGYGGAAVASDMAETLARLRRVPGIEAAGATTYGMIDGSSSGGAGVPLNGRRVRATSTPVTPGFFEATGTPLVAGRLPTAADRDRTAVVNEAFVRACCDGASPIGLVIDASHPVEIVGVVKDMHDRALDRLPTARAFVPLLPRASTGSTRRNYVFRAPGADRTLASRVEQEIRAVNADAVVDEGQTLHERLMRSVNDRSFATLMVGLFALAATGVSVAGLAGVISFVAARRTREIAIRVAIGAAARDVRRLVVREAAAAAAAGSILGLIAGVWLSRGLQSLLYGVEPADPGALAASGAAMAAMVVLAAWVPTRRALRLSPTDALRRE